jgi:hypothetical protein
LHVFDTPAIIYSIVSVTFKNLLVYLPTTMEIKKTYLTILAITILISTSIASSITYGAIAVFATPTTFSPVPNGGSTSPNDGNTVVGDNDTFRQFLTCMLDEDGNEEISEEEITAVLEAGSEDPVVVEEGEIKDCFQPLYVTGTDTDTGTASPPISTDVDNIDAVEGSTTEDEESSETNEDDDDDGDEEG